MIKRFLVCTIMLTPFFSIHSMDQAQYTIPEAINIHQKAVNKLCTLAYRLLHHVSLIDQDLATRKSCSYQLVKIIEKMASLKLVQPPITEKDIGLFVDQTKFELSLQEVMSLQKPLQRTTQNHHFLCLFFARLATYNSVLADKSLMCPNKEHVKNYLKKEKIEQIVTKNAQRNISIPQQTVDKVTIAIPSNIGIKEFMPLIGDIQDIIKDTPQEAKTAIKLIYHDALHAKSSITS